MKPHMRIPFQLRGRARVRCVAVASSIAVCLVVLTPATPAARAEASAQPAVSVAELRRDGLPRKVLVGTEITGYDVILKDTLERRFQRMDDFVDAMAAQAKSSYPGKRLDLAVLSEYFMSRPSDKLEQQAVTLAEVLPRISACAKLHGCYMVVPMVLREDVTPATYSNAGVLVDREGRVAGIYRKVHPCTDLKYELLEGGMTPGTAFPVFETDFGRLGIQICYDVMYADGWQALAKQGAEIIALASETPQTARPSMYALQHRYYIVSATPRDHAAVYNPLGLIEAQAVNQEGSVLVHQIDLSYAIVGWQEGLDEGRGLTRKFGDKVGYYYNGGEDAGIFWSNDPAITVRKMMDSFGFPEPDADVERSRLLQDKVRGCPPVLP